MRRFVALLAVVMMVSTGAASAATKRVEMRDDSFSPATLKVKKGTRVMWTDVSGDDHTVTSYKGPASFNKEIAGDGSWAKRFRKPGTYKYRCVFHSDLSNGVCDGMCGKIRVRRR